MLPKEGCEEVFLSNRFASRYVFSNKCLWLGIPSSFIQRGCGRASNKASEEGPKAGQGRASAKVRIDREGESFPCGIEADLWTSG